MKSSPLAARHFLGAIVAALLTASLGFEAQAFIVTARNVEIPPNVVIVDSTGSAVPVGAGTIAVGYFPGLTDVQIENAASVQALTGSFAQFGGASAVNGGGFGLAGIYSFNAVAEINGAVNTSFRGNNVYTFIGNALDLVSSTEVLVFKHPQLFDFDGPAPGVTALLHETELPLGAELLVGHFPGAPIDLGFGPTATFVLEGFGEIIPEPSRVLLSALGLGVALMRRRRPRN